MDKTTGCSREKYKVITKNIKIYIAGHEILKQAE